jgi:membrane protein DedA with SNARE-associated domain/rhodanese-related sulfurtransferase
MSSLIQFFAAPGVPLVALVVFLEQIGLPVPAMPMLIIAGALAREGRLSLGLLLLASFVCTMAADAAWYGVGRRYGDRALRLLSKLALPPDTRAKTEALVERFGAPALLVAKFVPGFSTLSVPLAGASRMPLGTFFLFDGAGTLIWAGGGMAVGALFHTQVARVLATLSLLSRGGVVLAAAAAVVYVLWRVVQRRRLAAFVLKHISPDEIAARLSTEDAPSIFDARSEATRHLDGRAVPGSRLLRLGALEEDLDGVPKDREIVLYCACPSEATAVRAGRVLRANGFANVRLLAGGLDAWAAAGHPVQRLGSSGVISRSSSLNCLMRA